MIIENEVVGEVIINYLFIQSFSWHFPQKCSQIRKPTGIKDKCNMLLKTCQKHKLCYTKNMQQESETTAVHNSNSKFHNILQISLSANFDGTFLITSGTLFQRTEAVKNSLTRHKLSKRL